MNTCSNKIISQKNVFAKLFSIERFFSTLYTEANNLIQLQDSNLLIIIQVFSFPKKSIIYSARTIIRSGWKVNVTSTFSNSF